MAQDLTVNIKTTSDVPQAMDKAKTATSGFSKQVDDIKKKFSSSFKDIFLGFAAPMVLIQSAISFISSAIADAKQQAKEGLDLLAKGDSMFASAHDKRMAAFFKERSERQKESETVKAGRAEVTEQFLKTTEQGKKLRQELIWENLGNYLINPLFTTNMSKKEDVQKRAYDLWAQSDEGNAAMQWEETQEKQKKAMAAEKKLASPSKTVGPDSSSSNSAVSGNVVGVGSNPVVSAIHESTELARQQLEYLRMIASKGDKAGPPADLTEKGATPNTPASPSRLSLLIPQK